MTSEIRNFTRDVCGRIKWKKARPLIQYELEDLMDSIYQDYISAGMEHTQAVAQTMEDTGVPSELAAEYNAEYRPNRPWDMVFLMAVILACGFLFSGGAAAAPGPTIYKSVQELIAVIGAASIGYLLDTDLFGKYFLRFYVFYLLLLSTSAIVPLEKGNTLAPYLFMMHPVLFSVHVCTSIKYGGKGLCLSIAMLYPTTLLALICQAHGQQLISVAICLIIGAAAVWKGYYPRNDKRVWCISGGMFAVLFAILILSSLRAPAPSPAITPAEFGCVVRAAEFIGKSHLPTAGYDLGAEYTVIRSVLHIGVLGAGILIFLYVFFYWSSFASLRRIKSGRGQFFALSIILVLLVSFAAFFLSNAGVFPYLSLPVPFIRDGPAAVFSGFLAGSLLSVIRDGQVLFDGLALLCK